MKDFGIDVSHHQNPKALPWAQIAETSSFAIVRATYGTMRDRVTAEHMVRARAVGLDVGVYHFFRPSQPWQDQLGAFTLQVEAARYGQGDIVPVLDVEADPVPKPGTPVSPAWQEGVRAMLEAFRERWGGAIVYITQREFGHLGKPDWLLEFPLWVAHYTQASKPATPGGRPWLIWQHRVGAYDPNGPGGYFQAALQLDQNRLNGTLPLVGGAGVEPPGEDGDPELDALLARGRLDQADHVDAAMRRVREDAARDVSEGNS